MYMYMYIYMCVCISIYIYMYVCMHVCICISIWARRSCSSCLANCPLSSEYGTYTTVKALWVVTKRSDAVNQVPASAAEFGKAQLLLVYLDAMPAWQEVPPFFFFITLKPRVE